MKKINKKVLLCAAAFSAAFTLCAQEASESPEENIVLPDVSTVISGGAPKAGKSAVPDFSKVLPDYDENKVVLPKLPDANGGNAPDASVVSDSKGGPRKNIYAEGLAGAGYPGFFIGNFSIYRQSGNSPFSINFSHETVNGYGGKSLTSGYFDRKTGISAEKKFASKSHIVELGAKYESTGDGLQNNFDNISDITKNLMGAYFGWNWNASKCFELNLSGDGNWYRRFATITGTPSTPMKDYVESVNVLEFCPKFSFGWNVSGFHSYFGAEWTCENDVSSAFDGSGTINRGNFFVDLGWKNSVINIYGNASAVVGNKIGDNDVIVPFTAGLDFTFLTKLSSRQVRLSLSGGIESELPKVYDLERHFKFSSLSVLPSETSSWYGKASILLPVKDVLSFGFDGKFMKTACSNGVWQPDYKKDSTMLCGQYLYSQEDFTTVKTDSYVSFKAGPATFSAEWNSFWGDVPSASYSQFVNAGISLQDKKSVVVFDGKFGIAPDPDDDNCPVVDLSLSFKLTEAVRLAVTANDVVKLTTGNTRTYAGKYIQRSGWAGIEAKFFF